MSMLRTIIEDIKAAKERDPAARSYLEIVLCYSGLHAIVAHRINHWLWNHGFRLLARFGSQVARFLTGIEIHPGAKIGRGFFIDHGMGTVIGETTEIGNNVTLFQGVTLGGTGKERGKRHPTLEDDVTVGAHAQVLGSLTVGRGSVIGAGAVVVDPVPPHCTVVGTKAYVVRREGKRVYDFRHDRLPRVVDPTVECLLLRVQRLERQLADLELRWREACAAPAPPGAEASPSPPEAEEAASAVPAPPPAQQPALPSLTRPRHFPAAVAVQRWLERRHAN
jgi:serine O-acetyltransferase